MNEMDREGCGQCLKREKVDEGSLEFFPISHVGGRKVDWHRPLQSFRGSQKNSIVVVSLKMPELEK